ncbi:MFS transporter [Xylophilus sp. GW821-FHT01B05]
MKPAATAEGTAARGGGALPLLVAAAFFMENLDGTVIVTALPQMAASFGVRPVDMSIGVSAYILTLAVLIPASGWVADRLGARKVFAAAIVLFTLASVLCGISPNLGCFTAARVLQGAAGAMMVPVGRLVVLRSTPKSGLMRAIATITWPGLAAPVLGPPLGGFITTHWSWHWIFFLNVPLGLLGLVFALRLIPKGQGSAGRPFDAVGFVLTGSACLALMAGVELLSHGGHGTAAVVALVAGLLLGWWALRHARGHAHPLVDLWALRVPSYAVTVYGGSLFRISIGAIPFLLPLLFQLGFGLDAFHAGMLVLAVFAGNLAMKPMTGAVLRRFSFRTVLLGNGLINALSIFVCALLTPATPVWVIVLVLFISGLSRSMQFTTLASLAFADVPQPRMSGANTLLNMSQQMAMGMGVALGAVVLRLAALLTGDVGSVPSLADFRLAFVAMGVLSLLAMLDVRGLSRTAGDEVRLAGKKGA